MTIKVLIVDDSLLFHKHLEELIASDPEIEIIGVAQDGKEAINKNENLNPDIITMDVKMPIMDGISSVKAIMSSHPKPIIMLSALTLEGAQLSFDALDAGAIDFVPKEARFMQKELSGKGDSLLDKIKTIAKSGVANRKTQKSVNPSTAYQAIDLESSFDVVVIATSTGGPIAVQTIISQLPYDFPLPLVVVQHMPESYTGLYADRLNRLAEISVKEAEQGEFLLPGVAYIAPGGQQLYFDKVENEVTVRLKKDPDNFTYNPSADETFESAAEVFKDRSLSIVLTGMGKDGAKGATFLKKSQAAIWVQDEESSVVFGMPQAVADKGLADRIMNVDNITKCLLEEDA